jgi:hypothetical protein
MIKVLMRNIEPWEWILGVDLGSGSWDLGSGSWEWILGSCKWILGVDLGSGSWDLASGSRKWILGGDLGRKSIGIVLIDEY